MAKGQSLQDPYLNALRRERIPVSIYLVNGIKLQGQIESFDQFVILLKTRSAKWYINTRFQLLYLLERYRTTITTPIINTLKLQQKQLNKRNNQHY